MNCDVSLSAPASERMTFSDVIERGKRHIFGLGVSSALLMAIEELTFQCGGPGHLYTDRQWSFMDLCLLLALATAFSERCFKR